MHCIVHILDYNYIPCYCKVTDIFIFQYSHFSMDFEKLVLTFTLQGDFTQTAKYNVTGKVMLLPVYGEGDSTFKFSKFSIY